MNRTLILAILCFGLTTTHAQELLTGHRAALTSLDFSRDGKLLLSNSRDGLVLIWDVEKREVKRAFGVGRGTTKFIPTNAAFMPDGKTIVVAGSKEEVQLWDIKTGDSIKTVDARLSANSNLVVNSDAKHVAWDEGVVGGVIIWDSRFEKIHKLDGSKTSQGGPLVFSPDGSKLLTFSDPNSISLWDWKSGKRIAKKVGRPPAGVKIQMSFSPRGELVAQPAGFNEKRKSTVIVWDGKSGQTKTTLTAQSSVFMSHTIFVQRNVLITSGASKAITLWNVDTGQVIATLGKEPQVVEGTLAKYKALAAMDVSPDGMLVATCANDEHETDIRLWDISEIPLPSTLKPAELAGPTKPDFRTWTSADGQFKVDAMLIREENGDVTMLTRKGSAINVKLKKLCEADCKYIAANKK